VCAAWCDTCNAFRPAFEAIARPRPRLRFLWLDIEDDAALCGDVDVENFPTLLIYRGAATLHFGVSLPHEATVARLVDEMASRTTAVADVAPAVAHLQSALRRRP
jgi:thioredoxin reductase (NADPH)